MANQSDELYRSPFNGERYVEPPKRYVNAFPAYQYPVDCLYPENSFEAYVKFYEPIIFKVYMYKFKQNVSLSEDLTQQTLIRMWRHWDKRDPDMTRYHGVIRNMVNWELSTFYSSREYNSKDISFYSGEIDGEEQNLMDTMSNNLVYSDLEYQVMQDSFSRILKLSLNAIPEHAKELIIDYHLKEMTGNQISEKYGIGVRARNTAIHRARNLLQDELIKRGITCPEMLSVNNGHGGQTIFHQRVG